MVKFNVYLAGKLVDSVFYNDSFDSEEVKESLINHDGYNSSIKVVRARNITKTQTPLSTHQLYKKYRKYSSMEKVEAKLKKMAGF